jgi:hypothetical protein
MLSSSARTCQVFATILVTADVLGQRVNLSLRTCQYAPRTEVSELERFLPVKAKKGLFLDLFTVNLLFECNIFSFASAGCDFIIYYYYYYYYYYYCSCWLST